MQRRFGWALLAAVSALFFALSAIALAWRVGTALRDGDLGDVVSAAGFGAVSLVFWRWIILGAWVRYRPPVDPVTGEPEPVEPIGPWGWVGRALLAVMLIGFVAGGVWLATTTRAATDKAEQVRDRAEAEARRSDLTVADVAAARTGRTTWVYDHEGPDPYQELLDVPGARVDQVAIDDGRAAILIRPSSAPPCVVIAIDEDDLISSRLTDNCS